MIEYVKGDATLPKGSRPAVIVHCCNDIGAWGRGFVCAISARWKAPEREYRRWFEQKRTQPLIHLSALSAMLDPLKDPIRFELGSIQIVEVSHGLFVCNLIGQRDIRRRGLPLEPPIRYQAIRKGLRSLKAFAQERGAALHMPRLGAGLAGGAWSEIETIILEELHSLSVTVYDFEPGAKARR